MWVLRRLGALSCAVPSALTGEAQVRRLQVPLFLFTQTSCLLHKMLRFTSHIPIFRGLMKALARAAGAHPSCPSEGKAQVSPRC